MTTKPPVASAPKYVEVAETLETLILQGKWEVGRMPSVRGVAKEHRVSVVTASRAMQILRDKGLIQTVQRSGAYRVPPPTADRWAVCLRITPGPWQAATTTMVRDGFEDLARRVPMRLEFDPFDFSAGLTPAQARAAVAAAVGNEIRGVFLLPSRVSDETARTDRVFLEACRDARLPVVLLERNLRGIGHDLPTDLICLDDLDAGAACTRHLLETGRKRVGIVVASPVSTHNDRVAGYLYELYARPEPKRKAGRMEGVVIHQPSDLPTKEAYAAVADEVVKAKLDGVVCYSDYTALGLILELMQRGLKVPRDVGVVGFDNLPIGDSFAIGLTTYSYPAAVMADLAVRAVRDRLGQPERPPVRVIVPGELIVRGSTAR